jgi:hypothetical protein
MIYPLVNIQKAIEHGHRNSEFSHKKWWFSIVMLVYQRVLLDLLRLWDFIISSPAPPVHRQHRQVARINGEARAPIPTPTEMISGSATEDGSCGLKKKQGFKIW